MSVRDTITLLGGRELLGDWVWSELELAVAVEERLPPAALDALLKSGAVSEPEVERLVMPIAIARDRANRGERLTVEESDRLARLAHTVTYVGQMFQDEDKAAHWLRTPVWGLRGMVPLELAATALGARVVEGAAVKMASGVCA